MEERKKIRLAKRGDQQAIALLLEKNYVFVKNYLVKITLDPSFAEDLTQETMIRAIERIQQFKGNAKFSTWLIQIATNVFLDEKRKQTRRNTWMKAYQQAERMRWNSRHAGHGLELLEGLAELPDEQRIALILKHYYGYTYNEIALFTGAQEGTVKSRVYHAIQALRKESHNEEGNQ